MYGGAGRQPPPLALMVSATIDIELPDGRLRPESSVAAPQRRRAKWEVTDSSRSEGAPRFARAAAAAPREEEAPFRHQPRGHH